MVPSVAASYIDNHPGTMLLLRVGGLSVLKHALVFFMQ